MSALPKTPMGWSETEALPKPTRQASDDNYSEVMPASSHADAGNGHVAEIASRGGHGGSASYGVYPQSAGQVSTDSPDS